MCKVLTATLQKIQIYIKLIGNPNNQTQKTAMSLHTHNE